ncbi:MULTISPECIES: flagellin [Clostridium]|uniref:Flagellin n=1 Tax=Clostridium sartagoforme AAU1 TaxID=1202534 RepID=R9CCX8_9CLOT|nr:MULTISPECIES: flagellin [Clostridium]EOR27224.1 flagellin [Clostridium sartagoforme AAU1]KLE15046.1 flagellin [Clostridium sp. C8]
MRLNQNMESLNVYRNYKKNLTVQAATLNKISTGSKINSAKDNPNKLGVSEGLRMQIRSLQMAEKNIQDGVSMIQATDGALATVNETLSRIKELTVQAGGVQNDGDLEIIQGEINQLKEHIDDTVNNFSFNGVKLLNSENVTNNDFPKYLNHVVGANVKDEVNIPIFNVTTEMLIDSQGNSLKDMDVTNKESLSNNLNIINSAISTLSSVRSKYGAIQNRLETSAENLSGSSLNLESAESRIRDTDIAFEMAEYAKTSILHESSIALMQQTNKFPQDVLRILENLK